jgi:ribonucleoside-diphosphate reductase alpha chain
VKHSFNRPVLNWKDLVVDLKNFGIRNSCQTTIQPTGAIATITGLEGYGCEPVFALSYVMKTHEGATESGKGEWAELYYESRAFSNVLKTAGLSLKQKEKIFAAVRANGSCQHVSEIPAAIRQVFVVSSDVKVEEHVRMQAAFQAFTDNAISKTINFSKEATIEDVKKAYLDGWKMGLKGMTVYVTGSRQQVVLETHDTKRSDTKDQALSTKDQLNEPFASEPGIVGKTLEKFHPDDFSCPECGSAMILSEGCASCTSCGYSKCSL